MTEKALGLLLTYSVSIALIFFIILLLAGYFDKEDWEDE
jgi:hypothetical protein